MKKIHFTDRYLLNPRHPVTVFVIGAGGTGSQVILIQALNMLNINSRYNINTSL